MKTFNFNKPYKELSFNEVLSVLLEIGNSVDIVKTDRDKKLIYNVDILRVAKYYKNDDEFNLKSLSFTWYISSEGKDLDKLENQNYDTMTKLDSYFESAINLGLIKIK